MDRSAFLEEGFIKQLSIDCVVFGYQKKELKVLSSKLLFSENVWALPGGFIKQTESIDQAAYRILQERTGIDNIYLEQFKVFGASDRVNHQLANALSSEEFGGFENLNLRAEALQWLSQRFVSIGYYALVDMRNVKPRKTDFDESVDWYTIDALPKMIIDHNEMVKEGLEALRQHLDERLIGFNNLLPETFTMRELQELYETVYDRPFARNNFQKKILELGVLERLEKKFTGAQNRAPYLYRFKQH